MMMTTTKSGAEEWRRSMIWTGAINLYSFANVSKPSPPSGDFTIPALELE